MFFHYFLKFKHSFTMITNKIIETTNKMNNANEKNPDKAVSKIAPWYGIIAALSSEKWMVKLSIGKKAVANKDKTPNEPRPKIKYLFIIKYYHSYSEKARIYRHFLLFLHYLFKFEHPFSMIPNKVIRDFILIFRWMMVFIYKLHNVELTFINIEIHVSFFKIWSTRFPYLCVWI